MKTVFGLVPIYNIFFYPSEDCFVCCVSSCLLRDITILQTWLRLHEISRWFSSNLPDIVLILDLFFDFCVIFHCICCFQCDILSFFRSLISTVMLMGNWWIITPHLLFYISHLEKKGREVGSNKTSCMRLSQIRTRRQGLSLFHFYFLF